MRDGDKGTFDEWRKGIMHELQENNNAEKRNLFTIKNELSDIPNRGGTNPYRDQYENDLKSDISSTDYSKQENTNVRTVEVYWYGKTRRLNFTMPQEHTAFSPASKDQFIKGADLSNAEARAKSLLEKYEELYDEMSDQFRLSKLKPYEILSKNFMNLKYLTYAAVIVLNFNIMISDVETLDEVSIYKDMVGDHLDMTEVRRKESYTATSGPFTSLLNIPAYNSDIISNTIIITSHGNRYVCCRGRRPSLALAC